jgi:hypothetical protein
MVTVVYERPCGNPKLLTVRLIVFVIGKDDEQKGARCSCGTIVPQLSRALFVGSDRTQYIVPQLSRALFVGSDRPDSVRLYWVSNLMATIVDY